MNESTARYCCPMCGGRVYRSSKSGRQVYRCNDLLTTGINCPLGREPVARTKAQVRRVAAEWLGASD